MSDEGAAILDGPRFEDAAPPYTLEAYDDSGRVKLDDSRLPQLCHWGVLLRPWSAPKVLKSGIHLPDQIDDANRHMNYVFRVVAIGPLAYTHKRLEGARRPQIGDWVIVTRFSGISLTLKGQPLRICNDDDIIAIIDSPDGWRAFVGD